MISPLHAPRGRCEQQCAQRVEERLLPERLLLAGADCREPRRILNFVAERKVVGAEFDQPVELRFGRDLDPDERAHLALERLDERRDHVAGPPALVAGVEMNEGDVGFALGGPRRLHDLLDRDRPPGDVSAGRAEAAREIVFASPILAGRADVDSQISTLEDAYFHH